MKTDRVIKTKDTKEKSVALRDLTIGSEKMTAEDVTLLAKAVSAIYCKTSIPEGLLQKVHKEIIPKYTGKRASDVKKADSFIEMMRRYALETQSLLYESVQDGASAVEVASRLIEEYDCKTASEKATAQIIANAYMRILENSHILRASRSSSINYKLIPHFAVISKELDRATRQYEVALNTLMRMKSPSLEINVTAKTAFVANNQQINATQNNHENVTSK